LRACRRNARRVSAECTLGGPGGKPPFLKLGKPPFLKLGKPPFLKLGKPPFKS
jgi:hypothetical protein